jgi:hypothetical protein
MLLHVQILSRGRNLGIQTPIIVEARERLKKSHRSQPSFRAIAPAADLRRGRSSVPEASAVDWAFILQLNQGSMRIQQTMPPSLARLDFIDKLARRLLYALSEGRCPEFCHSYAGKILDPRDSNCAARVYTARSQNRFRWFLAVLPTDVASRYEVATVPLRFTSLTRVCSSTDRSLVR